MSAQIKNITQFKWLLLISGLSLCLLLGCADGIVIEPAAPFHEQEVVPERVMATPSPEPQTPAEHIQYRLTQAGEIASQQRGLVWPVLLAIALLWGLIQLLKWIYELTTSSPPLA